MGITADLAKDLYAIKKLEKLDIEQLHTLIIDFFAARAFNICYTYFIYFFIKKKKF